MQCEFSFIIYNGMACIAAALKSDYNIIILGQQIDHASLAFIAPVNAYYCTV